MFSHKWNFKLPLARERLRHDYKNSACTFCNKKSTFTKIFFKHQSCWWINNMHLMFIWYQSSNLDPIWFDVNLFSLLNIAFESVCIHRCRDVMSKSGSKQWNKLHVQARGLVCIAITCGGRPGRREGYKPENWFAGSQNSLQVNHLRANDNFRGMAPKGPGAKGWQSPHDSEFMLQFTFLLFLIDALLLFW